MTTCRSSLFRELPFEVAVWLLESMGKLKDRGFYFVATYDETAVLAAQFLSPRMPVSCNVVVGFTTITDSKPHQDKMNNWITENVKPNVIEMDSLPPVDWNQTPGCSHTHPSKERSLSTCTHCAFLLSVSFIGVFTVHN